ncbi:MAG: PBP1A family penicillin-binding protein [Treponema sp.]|jgi:penicillin-binding protein 1A|nr:PBP1A family penicillin-binding protein [Treponema sp.]
MAKKITLIGKLLFSIAVGFIVLCAGIIGIGLGWSLAETRNIKQQENFAEFAPALPTKIMDIEGNVVTEFSADEKRELITLNELPRHLIDAVLSREDPDFYDHIGFSIRGTGRAAYGMLTGQNLGGGSTITQQIAGTLYTDRTEYSMRRKIVELWWAFQMERRYTKNEILELYLNYIYMGPGVYGVEAASKYFFGHSAREITLAESAVLVIQFSSPEQYNPIKNPNDAMNRQRFLLDRMIEMGYTTADEANDSFAEYWANYDYTRTPVAAYYDRKDAAPWFSEYVRRELEGIMYGNMDYYRDGYTVYTTLNMKHQEAAVKFLNEGIGKANKEYNRLQGNRLSQAEQSFTPILSLLSLVFDLDGVHDAVVEQGRNRVLSRFEKDINPMLDMSAMLFGIPQLKVITHRGFNSLLDRAVGSMVEGAIVSVENDTGYITAIVGGSKYDEHNQLIRATQSKVMPGSSFKPLYYSAAIDSRKYTAASLSYDMPTVFHSEDGKPYIPSNYSGTWNGPILLYSALAKSLNIPALQLLEGIGFDAAIDRAAELLNITDPAEKWRTFPRVYPLGLGIIAVSPLQMARAFSIFANQGREVTPIAIRSIEDRNGRIVMATERDTRERQQHLGQSMQIITPQNAWIMTNLLKKGVEIGTLASGSGYGAKFTFTDADGKRYRMPAAGKTGTTENWSDAWTVGFTPYYTTAVWYGFDRAGNSLGTTQSGAALAGPVWGDYMREIHQGLPLRDFVRPSTGVVDIAVCTKSGLLPNAACNEGLVSLPFLDGTQPTQSCNVHGANATIASKSPTETIRTNIISGLNDDHLLGGLRMPSLNIDLSSSSLPPPAPTSDTTFPSTYNPFLDEEAEASITAPMENAAPSSSFEMPYNPLLD